MQQTNSWVNVLNKSADAFRTISEVAQELDLPQHVLRFWETRFSQIKPMKRGGGRRYYRPDDVELLRGIKHLLYGEGYTIKGVQRILKEQGIRHVIMSVHGGDAEPENADSVIPAHMDAALHSAEPSQLEVARPPLVMPPGQTEATSASIAPAAQAAASVVAHPHGETQVDVAPMHPSVHSPVHPYETARISAPEMSPSAPPVAAQPSLAMAPSVEGIQQVAPEATSTNEPAPVLQHPAQGVQAEPSGSSGHMTQASVAASTVTIPPAHSIPLHGEAPGILPPATSSLPVSNAAEAMQHPVGNSSPGGIFSRFKAEKSAEAPKAGMEQSHMAKDDVRRLQSTLFELLECKRILDRARN